MRNKRLITCLLLLGTAIPLLWYAWTIGRSHTISVDEARVLVDNDAAALVLVETVPGEKDTHWPMASILQARSASDVPEALRDRPMVLLCTGGVNSAAAAAHLKRIGIENARSIRGGWQEWIAASPGCPAGVNFSHDPAMNAAVPHFRSSPLYEQWAVVLAFFGVKFIYSIAAAAIWYVLRRSTAADLVALRWAMLLFFVGEAFCFINVMVFQEHSMLLEHLHSVGMVLSLAWAWWALIEAADTRIIHYSDEQRCALSTLCHGCAKHGQFACGLRRTFILLIPVMALLAVMPLFSELRETAYNTRVLGALHSYRHPILHQLYEIRYLPVASIVLMLASLLTLAVWEKRSAPVSKILLSAGLGAMSFSFLRLVLIAWYEQNQVWFAFWEETTELLYIGAVAGVLSAFRRGLFPQARRHDVERVVVGA